MIKEFLSLQTRMLSFIMKLLMVLIQINLHLKRVDGLGREFYIPSQNLFRNMKNFNPIGDERIDFVATVDNITISVVPLYDIVGSKANILFRINNGQTFKTAISKHGTLQILN